MPDVLHNEVSLLNIANVDNDIKDAFTRKMISEHEEPLGVAGRSYEVNEFFIWNDRKLYKTIAPINEGATFVIGTNVELKPMSESLYELYAQSADTVLAALSNVEETANASRNYEAGEYIIWTDGFLYEVIADTNIASPWVVNTNISKRNNLSDEVTSIKEGFENEIITMAKNGAHNLLLFDLDLTKSKNPNGTWTGNTYVPTSAPNLSFTVNADRGTVTVNGTNGNSATYFCYTRMDNPTINDTVIMTGCPNGGGSNKYFMYTSPNNVDHFDYGEGVIVDVQSSYIYTVFITIAANVTVTNLEFKPMFRLATDSVSDFTPYAMTNRELTENVIAFTERRLKQSYNFPKSQAEVSGNNNYVTILEDGMAFLTYEFSNTKYSQFNLFINGKGICESMITSGEAILYGTRQVLCFPVKKGDVLNTIYYSTATMNKLALRVL